MPCTPTRWLVFPKVHINFGAVKIKAQNVSSCKQECLNNASCTGIDWNKKGLGYQQSQNCWIHGPWTASNPMSPSDDFVHFQLRKYSCPARRAARRAKRYALDGEWQIIVICKMSYCEIYLFVAICSGFNRCASERLRLALVVSSAMKSSPLVSSG